ncbi:MULTISPECIES: acetyl-CoA sensor PanZ family protein [Halomonadaceae]|uniref:N-acetyltransferase domain-containing protein n=1 Tax=Modicisalibacter zincidurans TaxID=1178777 RepID=A0ABP9R595_9GAMM|nr:MULTISPECIES: acetyl-CoA sensor PanZ family protein [Halomonas]MCD6008683.1 PanM family protein [Halomonas sp. IOP_31]MEA3251729.1 acetyl-CoA sensor PanZ family protein [Pseudomonadota bacterium]
MPVTLERLDHARWTADAEAGAELSRIYQDASPELLPVPAEAFVRGHLESGGEFYCARFNGRLLAAVGLRREPGAWWLSHFCVREATRRRGVGSRLMALVAAAAGDAALRIETDQLPLESQLLLVRLGYRLEENGAYFEFMIPASGGSQ